MAFYLGIDLGGTRVRAGVITELGEVVARRAHPSRAAEGPEAVFAQLNLAVSECLAGAGRSPAEIEAIGMGAPGPLDRSRGLVLHPPNLPGWDEIPVVEILQARWGRPVFLENDANAAAIGEARRGAGQGRSPVFYVTVSTGIGAGIVNEDRLYRGFSDAAGELGQTIIDPQGPPCGFGRRGCLEEVASGGGLLRQAQRLHPGQDFQGAEDIFAYAEKGETWARSLVLAGAMAVGRAIGNAINLLNPAAVVIGGGLSRAGAIWWDPLRREVDRTALPVSRAGLNLGPAALGDDAGLVGAALLARDGLKK